MSVLVIVLMILVILCIIGLSVCMKDEDTDGQFIFGFLSIFLFVGVLCNYESTPSKPEAPAIISEVEKEYIYKQPTPDSNFNLMLFNIESMRKLKGLTAPIYPFCDVYDYVINYSKTYTISPNSRKRSMYLHEEIVKFYESFPQAREECQVSSKSKPPADKAEPEVLKGLEELDTESIIKLTEVATECNIAKVKLIANEISSSEEVAAIIKRCKSDKLRETLNNIGDK